MSLDLKRDIEEAERRLKDRKGYIFKQDFKKYFDNQDDYYIWMFEHCYNVKLTNFQREYFIMFMRMLGK